MNFLCQGVQKLVIGGTDRNTGRRDRKHCAGGTNKGNTSAFQDPGFSIWGVNLLFGKCFPKLRENEENWTDWRRKFYYL